jgi:hypothetical protein
VPCPGSHDGAFAPGSRLHRVNADWQSTWDVLQSRLYVDCRSQPAHHAITEGAPGGIEPACAALQAGEFPGGLGGAARPRRRRIRSTRRSLGHRRATRAGAVVAPRSHRVHPGTGGLRQDDTERAVVSRLPRARRSAVDRPGRHLARPVYFVRSLLAELGASSAAVAMGPMDSASAVRGGLLDLQKLLAQRARPVVFFFDDVHLLFGSESGVVLNQLLLAAPEGVRFVLCSREGMGLDLAALTARGLVRWVTQHELRFTLQDVGALANSRRVCGRRGRRRSHPRADRGLARVGATGAGQRPGGPWSPPIQAATC